MIRLLIKTHNKTGLKYLCKRESEDWLKYSGSGVYWLKHLKIHGFDFSTELFFETKDKKEFKKVALEYSNRFKVVESDEWANLVNEQGDGGNTTSNKIWITDEKIDKYISVFDLIPEGWRRGRSKCIFNDKKIQKEFSCRGHIKNV